MEIHRSVDPFSQRSPYSIFSLFDSSKVSSVTPHGNNTNATSLGSSVGQSYCRVSNKLRWKTTQNHCGSLFSTFEHFLFHLLSIIPHINEYMNVNVWTWVYIHVCVVAPGVIFFLKDLMISEIRTWTWYFLKLCSVFFRYPIPTISISSESTSNLLSQLTAYTHFTLWKCTIWYGKGIFI